MKKLIRYGDALAVAAGGATLAAAGTLGTVHPALWACWGAAAAAVAASQWYRYGLTRR
ncbi:hypothetical protein [Streptomyces rubradiris]|uniref:Uncharacterized protein n=1 Tax=Streptomyces rubradiris TaxID=285531 RepID=A0ABQ3R516_STRRR|nr:hypothetical protein [Streptomyces rubradiris]GHH31133.1 hypothetical protein GCM10018792_78570 [Streptomyces rubradiris]GHI50950.1 hypothetical protein Srubr_07960 [Streptomyces rubradiris]